MESASRILTTSFRGDGAGSYPLTWSQRWMWRAVCLNAPDLHHLCITLTVPVPSGPDVDAALRAISALLAHHQSLRTSFYIDEHGEPRQVVVGRGQTIVRIYDVGDSGSSPENIRRLAHGLASAPFTVSELSARFLVVASNEAATHVIVAVSHLATDAWAARRIRDDLSGLVATGGSERPERSIVQLSDRTAYERSPDGTGHSDRSIRYWVEQISRFPSRDYLPARNVAEQSRFREVRMESEAVGAAAQLLSSQLRVGMPAVFVGLVAALLSERSGDQRALFLLFCHNRFTPSTSALSGPLVQNFPLSIEVGQQDPGELLRTIHSDVTEGSFYAQYDPVALASTLADLAEQQGISADLSYAINVHTSTSANALRNMNELSALTANGDRFNPPGSAKLIDGPALEREDMNFYLTAKLRGGTGVVTLRANTALLSRSEIGEFLRDLERRCARWAGQVQHG